MNHDVKLLFWCLAGPSASGEGEPWPRRLPTVGEVLKSDAYDFIVLPGVSAPDPGRGLRSMFVDLMGYMPDYSFSYTRHLPNVQQSHGIAICHRHRRWEADMSGGFRFWPHNTDRVLFCVLFHELDDEKKRTGRAVYVASCQSRDDEGLDIMREAIAMQMVYYQAKRPHPEYPVLWAGDMGMGAPSTLYEYVTGHTMDIASEKAISPPMTFQDPLAMLHPESGHSPSTNNWRDREGGVRRDFILFSDGLTPHSLDFNYIRTPGGLFPSNHYPQRAVFSFNERLNGQLH